MTDVLPKDFVRALGEPAVSTRLLRFTQRLAYFDVVESTNDVAMGLLESGAPDGTTVLASAQTSGRGRRGRSWFSPEGVGLYLSVVIRDLQAVPITLLAGVVAADGFRAATEGAVDLEWPNDLVVESDESSHMWSRRKKVGGILAEGASGGADHGAVVVGIGVNINSMGYPPDIVDRASSLEAISGRKVDRGIVMSSILLSLAEWSDKCRAAGGATMLQRWRELSPSSHGARVSWASTEGDRSGITEGIDSDGALRVRFGEQSERVLGGTLVWLPEPSVDSLEG